MSVKHITLKINSAKETVETYPITSQQGQVVIVQAQPNVRYQLIDEATQFGPENIMAKRVGQDLQISFEGTQVEQPDLIIQDYYATNNNIGYSNGQANMLIGQHESGSFYPYVPESAQAGDAISMLAEQITAGQALGGEHLVTALWLPLSPIGANWLFWGSMLALGAGGLIAAVAGNNDSSPNTPPATIDNLVPTASNDSSAGHTLGQAVTVNVLANDSDADGSLVPGSVRLLDGNGQAQTSLTVPGEGVWSVNTATGAITFTPNADFQGDPSPANYQVADNLGATARASVSVDYNQPPTVEVTLSIVPKQGEAVAGQPVATSAGTDPEGKPVTYSLDDPDGFYAIDPNSGVVTLSERGAAHINNGEDLPAVKVIVTDDAGLTGSDDSNITPPATIDNLVPTASNDSSAGHTLGQAVTVNVLANDSDADGSLVPGSVRLLDGNGQAQTSLTVPGEGVWSVNTATGAITFTPNADFTGDPTPVNYQVADNLGATARASVSVDYNQPPTVEVTLTITPKQGEAAAGQPVATSAGTDPEGKPVTYSLDDPDGFYAIDPTTGVVTLSERGAAHINNGEDLPAVKVIVTDEAGLTGSDDSNITPPATIDNLVPTASNDSSAGHTLGQAVTVNVLANDSDADGSLVPGSVRLLDGNGQAQTSLTVPGEGVWSVNTATGAITFTPNADFTGDPTPVNYQVADNLGATARASVSVDYNQPPTVEVTLTITPKQGEAVAGQPVATSAGTDPEGKPITYSLDDPDGFYAIDPTTGVVTLSERGAAHINNGEDLPAVKVIVTDEAGLTGSDDSNITPPATIDNLVPTASNDSSAGHTLGQAVTVNVLANDSDADGSLVPGSVRLLDGNGQAQTSLTVPGEGVWSVNTATGAITFTPNADFTGDPTPVNYQVADNLGATARASVSVDYNQPPTVEVTLTIVPKQGEAAAGQPVATSAGTDPEGKPVTYSLDDPDGFYAIDPTTGVVTLSEKGAAHINNGEDLPAVKVIVTDDAGLTGSDDSNITPPATIDNLVPTASNDSSAGHTLGQAVTVNVLANDSDADGSLVPGSVRLLDGNGQAQTSLTVPGEGVWSVNTATGAITFTPNADFTGDPTPVNYQVADNLGATARASVSVDYNQPPTVEVTLTIVPKQGEAAAGQPVATSAGTDPEGKPVTYSLDDPDGFYAIDPTTGVVTLSEKGAAHINNGEDLPAVKVIVTDDAGLTGSDDSNITPPATAGNLQGVASFAAIDESHLGLNGEYYGYSDGLAYNTDGSLKDGFFRHANDKYFGNLDGVSDMEGIINGRNAVNGAANNIVGTHTAAATNTPDARFKATKIDYGGVTNSLGHNPELASGSTTGMDENNSSLYKFLSLQGSTDAQSLVVEHGLGNTTDAGIRMTGYVYMEAGYYDFRVRSDDGFRLKIDGQTAVQFDGIRSDNWSDSVTSIDGGNTPHPDGFYVKGGLVAVELLYWEQGLNGQLHFQYQEHGSDTWKTLDLTNTLMINDSALPALNDLQDMVREADVWSIRAGEVLDGGAGNDVIVGSAGRDYIMGAKDNDTLTGGDGNDTFIYSLTQDNGTDTITDFTVGKDKIVFSDVLSAHDLNPNTPAWLSPDNAQWDDAAKTLSFSGSENGVSYTNNVHFSNMSDSYATVAEFLAANGVV